MSQALIEGLKSLARSCVLAVIPVFLTALTQLQTGGVDWKLVGTLALSAAGVALLTGIDKWIHESTETKLNGLVNF